MKRRTFGIGLTGLSGWPLAAAAQPVGRVHRVGVLRPTAPDDPAQLIEALRSVGYELGKNLLLEQRFAGGDLSRLPGLAGDLVNARPDVILAVGLAANRAIVDSGTTIPVVMFANIDPVASGLVANVAHPGGNLTGVLITSQGTLAPKKLELLKEAVPQARRVAMLAPDDSAIAAQVREVQEAAALLTLELIVVTVKGGDYEEAFANIVTTRAEAIFLAAHSYFVRDRRRIIDLAERHRLPAMYEWPDQVRDGGLMAYGANLSTMYQQIANYIDRILRGTKAGDLPIVMPSKLHLALNLRTAKAIDFTFPPFVLARADELIE